MKGYFTWFLVLVCVLVILSGYALYAKSMQNVQSKQIFLLRSEHLAQNVVEASGELMRQEIKRNFTAYDESRFLVNCLACPSHYCLPYVPAYAPDELKAKRCDERKCDLCFEPSVASSEAEKAGIQNFHQTDNYDWDSDYNISIEEPKIKVFLKIDPLAKNGYSLDYYEVTQDSLIRMSSEKFHFEANYTLPKGFALTYEQDAPIIFKIR
ncbi:hypothetical protein HY990_00880 [Candidatus Micrarchaeota archaeon]|nr:hypothetical protein [Candidatus Micrarchaeota archaeon]